MHNILSQHYRYNDTLKIWQSYNTVSFNYSDGDDIETSLYNILGQVNDKSILSDELRPFQTDWASTYHLSQSRANLLRPLETLFLNNARVLELGCGCGGISRYLAETGAQVCAVEGSLRRASITALRCADLKNIHVIADCIQNIPSGLDLFDVVTLIGVLEYARLFSNDNNPELELLKKARSFLKPNGILILAIENKLGLKYIAGVPEEHIGTSWTGIMDGYTSDGITTFSRKELQNLLIQAGFSHLQQFIPLPDYKLPITILHPEGIIADEKEFRRVPLLTLSSRSFEEKPLFNIQQAWKSICDAGMISDMADSLCFTAQNSLSETMDMLWPKDILASHYGSPIQKKYAKNVQFVRSKSGIHVLRNALIPGLQSYDANFMQLLEDEPYVYGELLIEKIRKLLVRPGWTIEQLSEVLKSWLDWLQDQVYPGTMDLPPQLQDAAPFNVIIDEQGTIQIIDIEWTSKKPVPLLTMLTRTLWFTFQKLGQIAPPAENVPLKIFPLIVQVLNKAGYPETMDSLYKAWEDSDNKITSYLDIDSPWDVIKHSTLDTIMNIPNIHSLHSDCNKLQEEYKRTQKELIAIQKNYESIKSELISTYASRSWRITAPIRFCTTRLRSIYRLTSKVIFNVKNIYIYHKIVIKNKSHKKFLPICCPTQITLIPGLKRRRPKALQKAQKILKNFPSENISIKDQYSCLHGSEKIFANTTTVILAHFDPQDIIDPYIIYMCQHFKTLNWKVIIVSAGPISSFESNPDWADAIICHTCTGYDFTSWKAALDCFPSLLLCNELILCNDSVFGAVGTYKPIHDTMAQVYCDFWGITESHQNTPHLQNYYLVFRKRTLTHEAFSKFFHAVPLDANHSETNTLKFKLSLWLTSQGLRPGAFIPQVVINSPINPVIEQWRQLLELGIPLIKKELLQKNTYRYYLTDYFYLLGKQNYPVDMIKNYFLRLGIDIVPSLCSGNLTKNWPPDVLSLQCSVDLNTVLPKSHASKDLAVFIHIYYIHLLPELIGYLRNIPYTAHLHISTDTEDKAVAIEVALSPLGFALLNIRILPNMGWDIAPFFIGFADVIKKYTLLLRIHAKGSTIKTEDFAYQWRTQLLSCLMGTSDRVQRVITLFENQPSLGMLIPTPHYGFDINYGKNYHEMQKLLSKYDIVLEPNIAIDFPMGSMFWCRPEALTPLFDLNLTFEDFGPTDSGKRDGTLAHTIERLFLFSCGIAGFQWGRLAPIGYNVLHPYHHIEKETVT